MLPGNLRFEAERVRLCGVVCGEFSMRRYLWCCILSMLLSSSACPAQINVQTEDGNSVTIGPDGINIQSPSKGTNLNISPSGITGVTGKPSKATRLNIKSPSGSTVSRSSSIHAGSAVRSSGQTHSATWLDEGSLALQVEKIELSVTGKTEKNLPLVARVEKLEIDNLGAKGSGPLKERIQTLASTLGVTLKTQTQTQTQNQSHSSAAAGSTTGIQISGSSVGASPSVTDINISPDSVTLNARSNGSANLTQAQVSVSGLGAGPNAVVINSNYKEASYSLNGGGIVINANNCRVKLAGHCGKLAVNGNHNQVACENVSSIVVTGNSNTISWAGGLKPAVVDTGNSNTLSGR
jgi:hypothetical protein